ncbi:MAG: hypothetical protein ACK5Q5_22415 [Planctomycetaceae bacterium]
MNAIDTANDVRQSLIFECEAAAAQLQAVAELATVCDDPRDLVAAVHDARTIGEALVWDADMLRMRAGGGTHLQIILDARQRMADVALITPDLEDNT